MSIKGEYGESENGNFKITDTIGIPHPYMITHHHVAIASDNFGGMLGQEAIREAEERGYMCGFKCGLSYDEHKQALLVSCKEEVSVNGKNNKELEKYLKDIVKEAEDNGYEGFAFKKDF